VDTQLEKWVKGILVGILGGNTKPNSGISAIRTRLAHEGLTANAEILMPILNEIERDTMQLSAGFASDRAERLGKLAQLKMGLPQHG